MRVLIISFYFPPFNSMGAVRVGKHAKYLMHAGHDVRVITAKQQLTDRTLPLEIPAERVHATNWANVNRPVELALGGSASVARTGYVLPHRSGVLNETAKTLGRTYRTLFHLPDGQIGWYPFAIHAARKLLAEWQPDVIYASSLPITSLLIAQAISRTSGVPWIAEMRDLWLDNANRQFGPIRDRLEAPIERRVLSRAQGLVTVSEPLADKLRSKVRSPVFVVLNGFDNVLADPVPVTTSPDPSLVRIVYTGMIYAEKQDPSPLFQALSILGQEADHVRVTFVGRYLHGVLGLAQRFGVERCVEVLDPVPYPTALRMQRDADALLLLLWNDAKETGVFTGKLFEYVGSRRPILAIGANRDVAAKLIVERALGTVSADSRHIAAQLRRWISMKADQGRVPAPSSSAIDDLSREAQTRRLIGFFDEVVRSAGA